MYIPVKAVKETAAVGVRVHSLLVGFLRPFFVVPWHGLISAYCFSFISVQEA